MVINAKYCIEQFASGSQGRSGIDKEENADDHGGYTQQDLFLVLVAVAEKFRQSQRVVGHDGVGT